MEPLLLLSFKHQLSKKKQPKEREGREKEGSLRQPVEKTKKTKGSVIF